MRPFARGSSRPSKRAGSRVFLAFPALLPASLTFVDAEGGRTDAIDDARGARLGALALFAFAALVRLRAECWPPFATLGTAAFVWTAVNFAAWAICFRNLAR
jgi:hypothetical protein